MKQIYLAQLIISNLLFMQILSIRSFLISNSINGLPATSLVRQMSQSNEVVPEAMVELCRHKGLLLHYGTLDNNNNIKILQLTTLNPLYRENPFFIDLDSTRIRDRGKKAKTELIIKSAGKIINGENNILYDLTAGLGRDSVLFAYAGYSVIMIERNPILYHLLNDALLRLRSTNPQIASRLSILNIDATDVNAIATSLTQQTISTTQNSLVYLDPMYPINEIGRKSNVKKEMQIIHNIIGEEEGEDEYNNKGLFASAVYIKSRKIIVKRPITAEYLAGALPHSSLKGSTHRFDIYFKSSPIKYVWI